MRPSIGLLVFWSLAVAAAETPPDQAPIDEPVTQESKDPAPPANKQTAQAPTAPKVPQNAPPAADASPDVFKPSESVSEDAAVAYPVDI